MKKLSLLLLASATALSSFAQNKKVLLEDFTGIWCPHCVNGAVAIDSLMKTYPSNFIGVANHNYASYGASADVLQTTEGRAFADAISVSSFPTGAVDRQLLPGNPKISFGIDPTGAAWKAAVGNRVGTAAIASISFANRKKQADGTFEADVKVKFTSAPKSGTPVVLQVYVTEDKIPATGNTTQQSSGAQYGGKKPLTSADGYYHNHTLRASLGGTFGFSDAWPTAGPEVNKEYTKHISFKIDQAAVPAPWVQDECEVIAFVAYNGSAMADKEVLNAEKTALKIFWPTGVNNVENKFEVLGTYPNPATASSVINVLYNLKATGNVSMNVFNSVGQVVAQPYNGLEVAGNHTIMWRASDYNLAPGMYVMQITSAEGTISQKINIQ